MIKRSKSKEETSSSQLIWMTEYAFVSPYSVDECIKHLNALEAKYRKESFSFWKGTSLKIETLTDNGGVVYFKISATALKQAIEVRLIGHIIYKDYDETTIKTQIGVTRQSIIIDIIINLVLCLLFTLAYMSITALIGVIVVSALIHLTTYATFLTLKSELRASVYEALTVAPTPRPQTLPL